MRSPLSKNAQTLRYLLEIAPGVGHTLLAKFVYLADLLARQHLARPISEMEYKYDNHGPFDAVRFYKARDELLEAGLITHRPADIGGYSGFEMFPSSLTAQYGFGDAESKILNWVARTYGSWTARDICDRVVYTSKPMQNAEPGRRLDMDQVNQKSDDLEFNLERLLEGERSSEEGRVHPLADVMHELRARHRR